MRIAPHALVEAGAFQIDAADLGRARVAGLAPLLALDDARSIRAEVGGRVDVLGARGEGQEHGEHRVVHAPTVGIGQATVKERR